MNLLELVIVAHRCRSTHHFIAFDALQLLQGEDSGDWKNLLLKHHSPLLKGAKAPDHAFKDFRNHVLHVEDGEWGGARDAAMEWYGKAVAALRARKWSKAAYALGVLTHYYADPVQPFHTAQSEEEGPIHRSLEWSIVKSRDTIKALIDARGYPTVYAGAQPGFVSDMVLAAARYSNPHYQTFIDHYDVHRAVKNPPDGLDETLLDLLADLISYATAGVAVLYERAFAEAGVKPEKVDLDLPGYFAALDIPIRKITRRMADAKDRKIVTAMYEEFVETGKVIKTLPDDDKAIRAAHCKQVLRKPLGWLDAMTIKPIGSKHVPLAAPPKPVEYQLKVVPVPVQADADTAPARPTRTPTVAPDPEVFDAEDAMVDIPQETQAQDKEPALKLVESSDPDPIEAVSGQVSDTATTAAAAMLAELDAADDAGDETDDTPTERSPTITRDSPVIDAPSIGPKTASRLGSVDVHTIGDLLSADPAATAEALNVRYIKADTLIDWQDQTRLMVEAPGLRVLDSQILVGAGIRSAEDLANASAKTVLTAATNFLDTPKGARVLWGGENNVDKTEVEHWIDLAKAARG
ncbi:MAG: DUF4332 domain-containing protein [Pseudomonadota bacterium]